MRFIVIHPKNRHRKGSVLLHYSARFPVESVPWEVKWNPGVVSSAVQPEPVPWIPQDREKGQRGDWFPTHWGDHGEEGGEQATQQPQRLRYVNNSACINMRIPCLESKEHESIARLLSPWEWLFPNISGSLWGWRYPLGEPQTPPPCCCLQEL